MKRLLVVGAALAVVFAFAVTRQSGGGGRYLVPKPAFTTVAGMRVPIMQEGRCLSAGRRHPGRNRASRSSCSPALHIDRNISFSAPGCSSSRLESTVALGELIAVGRSGYRFREAREIVGIDRKDLIALRGCDPPRWFVTAGLGFGDGPRAQSEADVLRKAQKVCDILGTKSPWCSDDREIRYHIVKDKIEGYAYLPVLLRNVRADIEAGRIQWRRDPVTTILEWTKANDGACTGYRLCRTGIDVRIRGEDQVTVAVVRQIDPNSGPARPFITGGETLYTARRPAGGEAWFVVRREDGRSREFGEDRKAADKAWKGCCDRILIDRG